jgi:hypothetical protein
MEMTVTIIIIVVIIAIGDIRSALHVVSRAMLAKNVESSTY